MDAQVTLRIDRALAARLEAHARESGTKRSAVVRAALEAYLRPAPAATRRPVRERVASYVGALRVDRATVERDELARTIRAHNWRD